MRINASDLIRMDQGQGRNPFEDAYIDPKLIGAALSDENPLEALDLLIRSQYRVIARLAHPDQDGPLKDMASDIFNSYSVLTDSSLEVVRYIAESYLKNRRDVALKVETDLKQVIHQQKRELDDLKAQSEISNNESTNLLSLLGPSRHRDFVKGNASQLKRLSERLFGTWSVEFGDILEDSNSRNRIDGARIVGTVLRITPDGQLAELKNLPKRAKFSLSPKYFNSENGRELFLRDELRKIFGMFDKTISYELSLLRTSASWCHVGTILGAVRIGEIATAMGLGSVEQYYKTLEDQSFLVSTKHGGSALSKLSNLQFFVPATLDSLYNRGRILVAANYREPGFRLIPLDRYQAILSDGQIITQQQSTIPSVLSDEIVEGVSWKRKRK